MKKVLLLAALGVAGVMSASSYYADAPLIKSESIEKNEVSESVKLVDSCYPVTYVLSCGERVYDTHCTSFDPILCDVETIWGMWDEILC